MAGPVGAVAIPASVDSWFEATSGYAVSGDDGRAFFDGTGHQPGQGFTVSDVMIAASSCGSDHGPPDAARNGFGRVHNGEQARAWLSRTELWLTAVGTRLPLPPRGHSRHRTPPNRQ